MRVNGLQDFSEDLLACVSHATQERLRDVIEKMTEIGRHRVEVLKVCFANILFVASLPFSLDYSLNRMITIIGCSQK